MGNVASARQGMRLLTLDIETKPIRAFVWSLHGEQHIALNQIEDVGGVICFAAKWHGQSKVMFYSDHHDGHAAMVQAAHDLMSQADAIITYNGKSFDMKHLRREMVLAGLEPPTPHKDVDLYTTVRSQFKFASNKLDHVSDQLGIGSKIKHAGFSLWTACMDDDPKAWADMRRYCMGDVVLTEKLHDRLLPWIKNYPNRSLYEEGLSGCQACGDKTQLIKRGFKYTAVSKFQQFQCKGCGAYSAATHREKAANRVSV
jgi:DNA polymerase elongation subunit (family B)